MGCNSSTPVIQQDIGPRDVGIERNGNDTPPIFGAVMNHRPHRPITAESIGTPNTFIYGSNISLDKLLSLRRLFWDTRVEGNSMTWTTLKAAAEAILEGETELANALLEASVITAPRGTLDECYDEFGNRYLIPRYCFSNPREMMAAVTESKLNETAAECESPYPLSPDPNSARGADDLRIRIRVAPGENDFKVDINPSSAISELKRLVSIRIAESGNARFVDVSASSLRIIFMGKEIPDVSTVAQAGMNSSTVVHAYIRPNRA